MYKLIKHRGTHSDKIKENTYEAILNALNDSKYVGVEFDVRETKDHEFVIYHNSICNGKLISEMDFNELPKFIPKLKMVLKINSNKIFLIELKNITSFDNFYNLLEKYPNKNFYVMSFSNKLIKKVDYPNRHYKIGILNYVLNTTDDIKNLDFVAILNSLLNTNIMSKLKGLEIFSYGLLENLKYENVFYIVDK